MDDLEKLERVLKRIQARHAKNGSRYVADRTLREVRTCEDIEEALDYLERLKERV